MRKKEDLELRKLRAETELAERRLRESKRRTCGSCGGKGRRHESTLNPSFYDRRGPSHRPASLTVMPTRWVRCGRCGGSGGVYER
jgi:hypothetical protein